MPISGRTSPQHHRTLVLSAAVAALVFVSVTASAGPAQAGPQLLIGIGDSYTTGVGIPPVDESSGECQRSTRAYPLVAAEQLGYAGQNVACGGTVLDDFTSPAAAERRLR